MKKFLIAFLFSIGITSFLFSQQVDAIINAKEVERIERILSADDMQGRRAGTPGIDKAAQFIAQEFKTIGLQTTNNTGNFLQSFQLLRPKFIGVKGEINEVELDPKNIIVITIKPELKIDEKSGYQVATITKGENLFGKSREYFRGSKNYIVFVDTSFRNNFSRLTSFKRQLFSSQQDVIFILTENRPTKFKIKAEHEFSEVPMANVVGMLPGKNKKNEYVIFSGHYDHLGIGKPVNGDSIYNGANDDAAGITAVIMLAKYFKALGNNERSLLFVAFTAEESGGFGSQYFSSQMNPRDVAAMFNIEMIGTESKWGKNSAYITGYENTDMGVILEKNLKGTGFTFYPDPYPDQNLFFRSDNATLARVGVPAHTISTSKMDNEPNYHKPSDEIETLDMDNMAMIIKAIALSSKSIVNGTDTPSRVKIEDL